MSKLVAFSEESAGRIANAVRYIETYTGPRTSKSRRGYRRSPQEFPQVYEVTAVDAIAGTCTVKARQDAAGTLIDLTELTDVYYNTDNVPSVGDLGELATLGNQELFFFSGGAGVLARSPMIIAQANMTANDTAYVCKYLEADGTLGGSVSARRPNGVYISSETVGFLAQDSSGQNIFMPANMRWEGNMPLRPELRTDDSGDSYGIWIRTDI